ncbi:DUF7662 domain-containing protein [Lentzea terrae]|uniref:DUF7662 domain-containing protein n=1 Tax=Lentzea terrae TaxID=2200761 RepID=UPI000DD4104C|nr:hypothetical protein [Lentzea terrae]
MAGKYEPLTSHLAALAEAGREDVELDFVEIADMVGGLPPTAYRWQAWWDNDASGTHTQARAWRGAGWAVAKVDLAGQSVSFTRA